jgi:hypothetical protein
MGERHRGRRPRPGFGVFHCGSVRGVGRLHTVCVICSLAIAAGDRGTTDTGGHEGPQDDCGDRRHHAGSCLHP